MPLFNRKLWDLRNRVYRKLNSKSDSRPVLANVYRSYLRIAGNDELRKFVELFGPVQNNEWTCTDEPIMAYRWIAYSKKNLRRSKDFVNQWEQVLTRSFRISKDTPLALSAIYLNPSKYVVYQEQLDFEDERLSNREYFSLLLGILSQFVNALPVQLETLGNYLQHFGAWLGRHSSPKQERLLTFRYLTMVTLVSLRDKIFRELRAQEIINLALVRVIELYLLNFGTETVTSEVLGTRGLLGLVRKVRWSHEVARDIKQQLVKQLKSENTSHELVVLELVLFFSGIEHNRDAPELYSVFLDVCHRNARFQGLTYTAAAFWNYLNSYQATDREDCLSLVKHILLDSTSGKLADLAASTAYPNFGLGLMDFLVQNEMRGLPSYLLSILRPLIDKHSQDLQQRSFSLRQATSTSHFL